MLGSTAGARSAVDVDRFQDDVGEVGLDDGEVGIDDVDADGDRQFEVGVDRFEVGDDPALRAGYRAQLTHIDFPWVLSEKRYRRRYHRGFVVLSDIEQSTATNDRSVATMLELGIEPRPGRPRTSE